MTPPAIDVSSLDLVAPLCDVGRDAVAAGLVVASGGNLSVRTPGGQTFWVTAAGTWLDRLTPADFVEVRLSDGTVIGAGVPSTEFALHRETYRARPDVNAVIHLHPQLAILLDTLGEPIRLISTDHAFYLRRIARTPFHPPNSAKLGRVAARAVADGTNCVILAHHGCSVLGSDITMAWRRALNLEEAARLTYRALLLTGGLPDRAVVECPWELPETGLI